MSEKKKILIIDDDRDFVAAVRALLEHAGYAVRTAPNGTEGVDAAKTYAPDLVLLDVMMNERTEGFFTLQAMRGVPALERTPIAIVSSVYTEFPNFRVDPRAGWLPADEFLAKPVEPETLLREVARLIATPRPVPAAGRAGE